MSAIANGLALHHGFIPYVGTFLTFSDYARNALRMAALMRLRCLFVYTHDSIGLGEDGPTHQSVEHAAALRLIPRLDLWRPCDTVESAVAWIHAIERDNGPDVPAVHAPERAVSEARRGADCSDPSRRLCSCRLGRCRGSTHLILIATGSEVALAMGARDALAAQGIAVRVVSMPCTNLFDRQPASYRNAVLPHGIARVAVEAGVTDYWRKYVGLDGGVVGIDTFGESAPGSVLFKHFGFTVDNVVAAARRVLATASPSGMDHDHQSRDQRLRPHRPQYSSRALRRRQEARSSRSSPSTTSAARRPTPT